MSGRVGRLLALLALGLLALVASAGGANAGVRLPLVVSAVEPEFVAAPVANATTPTRVDAAAAKHGRTAPVLPAATLVATIALILYGFSIAGAPAVIGRARRRGSWSRCSRAPPARQSV